MTDGLHHFHKRKRLARNEPFPHPDQLKRLIDSLVYFGEVLGPLATVPQLATILLNQNASGVSIASWVGYFAGAIFLLPYGIVHKEKPIIFTYAIWAILDLLIVIATAIYR